MRPKRVFISHSSKDKPAVEALALGLLERGIEPWLDKWEIGPGDDIVASINAGLEEADAGIIVFSRHTRESRWIEAEVSYLTYARIQESKVLIPVTVGDDAWVPALLRPLARRGIEEIEAIADAILGRKVKPPSVRLPEQGLIQRVLISLRREGQSGLQVRVFIGDQEHSQGFYPTLPGALVTAQAEFLRGFGGGPQRNPVAAERAAQEASVARLGRAVGALCFPGDSGEAVANLIYGCPIGTTIEVTIEAEGPELLGFAFEALRLPDDRLLATQAPVIMLRRPAGSTSAERQPLAGPLKILVAVGAPDEDYMASVALDQERELQNILDAIELAQRYENAQVRILEVGHSKVIGAAIEVDAYHVLHLSCHGRPGLLELEDEDGRAVPTTAEELIEPLKEKGRPLPLVLLNACHGGVQDGQTASFAQALLGAGVPGVLAMQTSVSDFYASRLAGAFYKHLARREILLASRALAEARKELERDRLKAAQRGAPLHKIQPEYATATLFVAGEERPLADFSLDKQPLNVRPVFEVAGPVPQLRIDDLIGRRKELRETLRTLRDESRRHVGVVLTGIGGVGKSAVVGRAMQRLREDGWLIPAHVGRFDLASIALAMGICLLESGVDSSRKLGELLAMHDLDDRLRLQLVAQALSQERMALVLDDFEQNLTIGGGAFLNPDVGEALRDLARSAQRGRLMITSRYPVPDVENFFQRIPVGPLSPAESRKLLLRLDALRRFDPAELAKVLKFIGGHPRMLEFLDALQRGGQGRLSHVTQKLQAIVAEYDFDPKIFDDDLEESLQAALELGARDVFLEKLLDIVGQEGIGEILLQAAISNLPVTTAGLARMLAFVSYDVDNELTVRRALDRLEDLSLIHRFPSGVWVHRWTAEGLARLDEQTHRERCIRAGRYRWWRVEHESHSFEDAVEAMRNFLSGEDFDAAADIADVCFSFLSQSNQSIMIAALASEVLETLPEEHPDFAGVADQEAQAHLSLGATGSAFRRYRRLLERHERLAQAEPDRADYQRDLSVSYNKVGDLYRALGQGEAAREAYQKSLDIAERLAQAEPDRADYQRDLSVSYNKVGDLYRALGQGEAAREAYQKSLDIAERLAQAEPDRADYQRDLSVSYERMGDLYRALGQGEAAREAYQKSLDIAERLAQAEPDRADYQRDLSVSYERMGDLYRALGQGEAAREAYQKSLDIRERLAQAEPDRADYQRDLSMSYNKVGDLYRALGQGEAAREAYQKSLDIRERLAQAEPDRADYQRDLSVSYERMGDLYRALGQGEAAREAYQKSLDIAERLAQAEPDRADYQRDLVVSLWKVGTSDDPAGCEQFKRALAILEFMSESGRLDKVDEPLIPQLKQLIQERCESA